jgi:hypothetical protein
MSITFRISTDADDAAPRIATMSARQLATFRARLRGDGARLGLALLGADGQDVFLATCFEARVCPLPLATLAAIFDYDEDAIAVLEEAQFRARRVHVSWPDGGPIRMRVARTSDRGAEFDLQQPEALALLVTLGLRGEEAGEIPAYELRSRLENPSIRKRLGDWHLDRIAPQLEQLLSIADVDHSSRLEWA